MWLYFNKEYYVWGIMFWQRNKCETILLTKVLSGLKLWAQGHLVISPANNLYRMKQRKKNKTKYNFKCVNDAIKGLHVVKDGAFLWHNLSDQFHNFFCNPPEPPQWMRFWMSVVTHQGTETGPCQRHGEGCHCNRAEIEDSGIDVQWGESLKRSNRTESK